MVNPDSTVEVIEAIEAALKAAAGVTALVGSRIYDRVPQSSAFPFVSIGTVVGRPVLETAGDDGTEQGFEISMILEVWSETRSRKEAAQIMKAVGDRLLDGVSLATKTLIRIDMEDQRIAPVEEGVKAFGVQRWRIVTE